VTTGGAITREQRRAQRAYACVRDARTKGDKFLAGYRTAVNGLGPNTLRSGLSAAMAFLERGRGDGPVVQLLGDLGKFDLPGLAGATADTLPDKVRALPVTEYMMATRELLEVVQWLKRACQAEG
jgi:CRISPR-associated protein Cmr5